MATLCLIIDDGQLTGVFILFNVALGVLFPAWKYFLQPFQVLIQGPWDVAQISQSR